MASGPVARAAHNPPTTAGTARSGRMLRPRPLARSLDQTLISTQRDVLHRPVFHGFCVHEHSVHYVSMISVLEVTALSTSLGERIEARYLRRSLTQSLTSAAPTRANLFLGPIALTDLDPSAMRSATSVRIQQRRESATPSRDSVTLSHQRCTQQLKVSARKRASSMITTSQSRFFDGTHHQILGRVRYDGPHRLLQCARFLSVKSFTAILCHQGR